MTDAATIATGTDRDLQLADSALLTGRFDRAAALYAALPAPYQERREVALARAALVAHAGDDAGGRAMMRDYFRRFPVHLDDEPGVAARPLALRVRGFDRTQPTIGGRENGGYKAILRGGHFTTQFLLARDRIAQGTVTITDAGLDRAALPPHELLINTIAEPDIEGASLTALETYLRRDGDVPVINLPDRVWRTTRDGNYRRLRDHPGVTFPKTHRITLDGMDADALAAELDTRGFAVPVILRETGTQTARTTTLIRSRADLDTYVGAGLTGDHYAIAYREILWRDKYFRKLRLFWVDGAYYPCVCHLDLVWNVHGGNRKTLMRNDEALMAEERRFLSDWRAYVGTAATDAMLDVADATGLDFFGVDFTLDADGRPFLYELNPAMRHSFDHARKFPYKQPYDEATSEAFARMVERRAAARPT